MEAQCEGTGYAGLLLLAALVSIEMARTLTPSQVTLLSTFFEVLGNNLALLALPSPSCPACAETDTAEK